MATVTQHRSNPFPGLRPFRSDEHHLFFGREDQTTALLQLLRENRFLAVVGTSGSGKSSLVRAGMIAELYSGTMTRAGSAWEVLVLRPGGNPLENLARAFVEADLYDQEDPQTLPRLLATLKRSRFGLLEAVKQSEIVDPDTNLLVVVDQFEELFRFRQQGGHSEEAATAFVNLLLAAAEQTECPIYVTLTMRSDYLGDCSEIPGLAEAVNAGEYLIPRLQRDQKRDAIEKPVGVGGAKIDPLLVQQLLNDVGDDSDQLPVLQHALMRMWDVWRAEEVSANGNGQPNGHAIGFSHFEATGGLDTALSNHADEIYLSFDERQRRTCERIFRTLTEKGADNRGIRRPTRLAQLAQICGEDDATVISVLDAFRQSGVTFVMPGLQQNLTPRSVVDLSHESLMRGWERLRGWVEAEAQSARIFRRLSETATLWSDGKAGLFRDPDLQIALSWYEEQQPNPAWADQYGGNFEAAIDFLDKSKEETEARKRAEEEARQRELKQAEQLAQARKLQLDQQQAAAKRMRKLMAGLAVVAILAGIACVAALLANQKATQLAEIAEGNAQRADDEATNAKKHALEAEQQREVVRKTLYTADMNLAWQAIKSDNMGRAVRVLQRHFPDNERDDLRGWEWRFLWQRTRGDELFNMGPLAHHAFVIDFAPGNSKFVVAEFDGRVALWDIATRKEERELVANHGYRGSVEFTSDGKRLVAAAEDGKVRVWNWPELDEHATLSPSENTQSGRIRSLTISGDGKSVACYGRWRSDGQRVVVWDLESGDVVNMWEVQRTSAHHGVVRLSHDASIAYTGDFDGKLRAYRVNTGEVLFESPAHGEGLTALAVSPDGEKVATGAGYSDTMVKLWNAETGEYIEQLSGHSAWISWLDFLPDGKRLVSASADQTARVWDLESKRPIATLRGHQDEIYGFSVSSDTEQIITACKDGSMSLWNTTPKKGMTIYQNRRIPVEGVLSYGPNAQSLIVRDENGIQLLDTEDISVEEKLSDLDDVNWCLTSPNGERLICESDDELIFYDLVGRKVLHRIESDSLSQRFTTDGHLVMLQREAIEFWDVDAGRVVKSVPWKNQQPRCTVSPQGDMIVTVSGVTLTAHRIHDDGVQAITTFRHHKRGLTGIEFSPDGKTFATCAEDGSIFIYDVATWKVRFHLRGHLQAIHGLRFSADGKRLASGGGGADAIKLWDVESGQEVLTISTRSTLMRNIRFSQDGRFLTGVSWNNRKPVLHLWQAPSLEAISNAIEAQAGD